MMKDSGIEWIGEIPETWEVKSLKAIAKINGRIGFKGYTVNDLVDEYEENRAIVLGGTNVCKNGEIDYSKLTYLSNYKYLESPEIMLYGGEILITKVGAGTGENALYEGINDKVTINPNIMIVRVEKSNSKYVNYQLLSDFIKQDIYIESNKSGAQPAINQGFVKSLKFVIPQIEEQQSIANYLDKKCEIIDSTIEKQKTVIEKLKLYKQSLISEAVTKGLDPTVKMKPSGIEWIGDIPEGWKISKIKHFVEKLTDGAHVSPETDEGVYDFVSVTDIKGDLINFKDCLKTSKSSYESLKKSGCQPRKCDVLLSKDGTIGKSVVVREDFNFVVASSLIILTPLSSLDSNYLNYLIKSNLIQEQLQGYLKGTGLKRISVINSSRLIGVFPPLQEQQAIADYLDQKCTQIDNIINSKQNLIEKLANYKKSIIYECVTGKKEVI